MRQNMILKNSHGFTLVELLAVIVVLAIIMLLAVQAILPQMTLARRNALAIEANSAIEAAQSYVVTKTLTENLVVRKDKGLCVSIATLADGFYKVDTSKYSGYVKITQKKDTTNANYLYQVYLENGQYMANGLGVETDAQVNITGDQIVEYDESSFNGKSIPSDCPTS